MKILGLDIRKAAKPDLLTTPQIRANAPQGGMTAYFHDYIFRKVSGEFYEALREGIPMIDGAIRRLISLNGTIKIIGDRADLVADLEDFNRSVPVNDTQKGIQAFLECASNETFEQGFSESEFVPTPDLKDIAGLRVADSKQIIFRRNAAGKAEPWYRYSGYTPYNVLSSPQLLIQQILTAGYGQSAYIGGAYETKLVPSNLLYFSINNENTNPYGVSIIRSLEFVAKILATVQNSLLNVWERFGDPSFAVTLNATAKNDAAIRQNTLTTNFAAAITAKRAGKSADFVNVIGKEDKLEIKVIGADGQVLELEVPIRYLAEEIIGKLNLPSWMLGRYWSMTERMATLEVEMALQDAKIRQLAMIPEFIRLYSTLLLLRGRKWETITTDPDKLGDWGFYFETPNIRDVMAMANARFLNAQASLMERGGQAAPTATSVTVGGATFELPRRQKSEDRSQKTEEKRIPKDNCGCGKDHSALGAKELSRPTPWPELDKVEADYEKELKYDWSELKAKVFDIAGLEVPQSAEGKGQRELPLLQGEGRGEDGFKRHAPSAMPHAAQAKAFAFTDDQRAQILKALKDYLGWYSPDDPDSPIRWYYGQSYSLGLIQAANLMGKDRPLLDIIKNKEVFDQIAASGFDLVKNDATTAIKDQIIPAMEDGMTNGVNPRDVASTLSQLFDDANSDWERLARTEMTIAAEKAKVDEADARGIDTSDAVIAGEDTHPRCRCGNTIVDDGNGNFKLVFVPAPDACAICFAAAEGTKAVKRRTRDDGRGRQRAERREQRA